MGAAHQVGHVTSCWWPVRGGCIDKEEEEEEPAPLGGAGPGPATWHVGRLGLPSDGSARSAICPPCGAIPGSPPTASCSAFRFCKRKPSMV